MSLRSERRALLSERLVQAMGKMRENYDPGLRMENSCLGVERQPAYASYPGRANFLIHFLTKQRRAFDRRNKKLARLGG